MNKTIDISNIILHTERLVLRPWKESDLEDFYEYASVDGVGQMAGWNPHKDRAESKKILDSFIKHKKTFALEYKGKVIGSLGIEKYNEKHYPELSLQQGRELGYVLSKEYWGRGLMPEAVQAVIQYLFKEEKLDFILVGHFAYNKQSARVIEKCGFEYIKTTEFETRYNTVEKSIESILWNCGKETFSMKYCKNKLTYQDYISLRSSVGWNNFAEKQVSKSINNSICNITVVDKEKTIAMGRLIGDGIYYLIVDVVVRPEYQGQGIGSSIVDMLIAYVEEQTPIGGRSSVQLIAEQGKEAFYIKRGFKLIPHEFCGSGMRKIIRK